MKVGDQVEHKRDKKVWWVTRIDKDLKIARVENKEGDQRAYQTKVLKVLG